MLTLIQGERSLVVRSVLYRYATSIALDRQGTSAAAYLDELIDVWDPLEWVAHDEDEDDA